MVIPAEAAGVDPVVSPLPVQAEPEMDRRQILVAVVGVLLACATGFLTASIVTNALPAIVVALGGNQGQYTWVVTASLLATTATTPIWGKLADQFSKKLLLQIAISTVVAGSVLSGLTATMDWLIAWRALQGIGVGGLQALMMIVMAAMISPRERGRYTGLIATTMSLTTIGAPLLGGVIVDTPWLGWRWVFWITVPFALLALVLVQRTLRLPVVRRPVRIDWTGATLITAGVCAVLVWVTLGGTAFEWASVPSFLLVGAGAVLLASAVWAETRVVEPIVPLRLFRDRTTTLAVVASIGIGVALFGGTVFLGQYFQIARGYTPTTSGLLMMPMVLGSMIASSVSGSLISRWGRWKGFIVAGAVLLVGSQALLATLGHDTPLVLVGVYSFLLGSGTGMTMQNLILATQNSAPTADLGAATATVQFFRSLGATAGIAVLGALLDGRVAVLTSERSAGGVGIGDLAALPPVQADLVRGAYGDAMPIVFLVMTGLSVVTLAAVLAIREVALRQTVR